MKLTPGLKTKIDHIFDSHTPEEMFELGLKYGMQEIPMTKDKYEQLLEATGGHTTDPKINEPMNPSEYEKDLGLTGNPETPVEEPLELVKSRNPLAGRLKPVSTPDGAGKAALLNHKKRMEDKVFVNFQTTVLLKTQLTSVAKINRINISEYFRKCGEILVTASNNEERIVEISKLAASLVFQKKPRGAKTKNKSKVKKSSEKRIQSEMQE